jgi:hypothetical protein
MGNRVSQKKIQPTEKPQRKEGLFISLKYCG